MRISQGQARCILRSISYIEPPSSRRALHLAPPFLLDDPYLPRYAHLSSTCATQKRSAAHAHLRNCNLCPRQCSVNRYEKAGVCLIGAETATINTIAPHFGEEPPIQGHHGSGAVFFSGCNLRCVFCQNHTIAHTKSGFELTPEELAEWYVKLQDMGNVHNINLITPEHVVPQVVLSILHARELGLRIPIVYNTSAFDSLESIALLDGLVDIYLPDFKVWEKSTSKRLLKAEDYASAARESIKAMHAQVGDLCFTGDGIAKKGMLVRHLIMPGKEDEGREIMHWLGKEVSGDCFVNVMEQYRPDAHVGKPRRSIGKVNRAKGSSALAATNPGGELAVDELDAPLRYGEINRPINRQEFSEVRKAAQDAGLWRFCDPPGHGGFNI